MRPGRSVHDRKQRIEHLGVPLDALPDLIETTELAIRKWIAGALSNEEADIVEVALSMLEIRLARTIARRTEITQRIAAVA